MIAMRRIAECTNIFVFVLLMTRNVKPEVRDSIYLSIPCLLGSLLEYLIPQRPDAPTMSKHPSGKHNPHAD